MKTLSGANQTNIAGTFHDPDVLVEISSLSKQWSSKTRSGYETRILSISPLTQTVDPLGGLAAFGDFSITIQQETPTQFVQDQDVTNVVVDVSLKYGTDAAIPLISGRLDRWEFRRGRLTLHCVANTSLLGLRLPNVQITADNFSTFRIPDQNVGAWVPLTIGNHEKAKGLLIDKSNTGQKVKFNAAVSSHEAIGSKTDLLVWFSGLHEFVPLSSAFTIATAGHLVASASGVLIEFILRTIPRDAAIANDGDALDVWQNPNNVFDEDFTTVATATNISPLGDGVTAEDAEVRLRARIRDLPVPDDVTVLDDELYLLIDCDRGADGINDVAGESTETVDVAIELDDGTYPTTASLIEDVIPDAGTAFDNINALDDAETDIVFDTSAYAAKIGIDRDGDGTAETLPLNRLGQRWLTLRYIEAQIGPSQNDKVLTVNEMRLRANCQLWGERADFYADLAGYDDDGSGTYTGSANAVIENPADVLHFLLAELLAQSGFNTTSFSGARSDLGSYVIAGQALDPRSARDVLDDVARQGKLILYLDYNDEWAASAFTLPGSADATVARSDFVPDGEDSFEGEIQSVTQSPSSEIFNQFEILYAWNEATGQFDTSLVLDENTPGPIGDWLTESQSRYNVTRKMTVEARWIRTADVAQSYGNYLIYRLADRKLVVEWQTSWNTVDHEIGDRVALNHPDVAAGEDTTVYAGYRAGSPLATITAGYTDPDTSATIKAGAKVEHNEGRHRYEIMQIETMPLDGLIRYTGRQVDVSRSELSEPW